MTRYQDCSWLVRRWRDRWLLLVPYWAVRWWSMSPRDEEFGFEWSCALGWCDVKRRFFYTTEELDRMFPE